MMYRMGSEVDVGRYEPVVCGAGRLHHLCAPPGWWVRWRMGVRFLQIWECGCGCQWQWRGPAGWWRSG